MKSNEIRHTGRVERVEGDMLHVRILQTSACASCQARSMCMSSESKEKEIDCRWLMPDIPVNVGDEVEVIVMERLGWKAVLLAYILPFVVLVATVACLDFCFESEALVGTLALCTVGVYYIVLSFFRDRIRKQFAFYAQPPVANF